VHQVGYLQELSPESFNGTLHKPLFWRKLVVSMHTLYSG